MKERPTPRGPTLRCITHIVGITRQSAAARKPLPLFLMFGSISRRWLTCQCTPNLLRQVLQPESGDLTGALSLPVDRQAQWPQG